MLFNLMLKGCLLTGTLLQGSIPFVLKTNIAVFQRPSASEYVPQRNKRGNECGSEYASESASNDSRLVVRWIFNNYLKSAECVRWFEQTHLCYRSCLLPHQYLARGSVRSSRRPERKLMNRCSSWSRLLPHDSRKIRCWHCTAGHCTSIRSA